MRVPCCVAALVAVAVLALLAGGADGAPPPPQQVDEQALSPQVGQLVVLSFAGTSVPEYVLRALRENRVAGVVLFRGNLTGPQQAKALVTQLRRGSRLPPLICVDQEGGRVRILSWVGPKRSAPQQRAAGTERTDALAAARALRATGINVVLAPVADVPSARGATLASRAFSTDFRAAADSVAESVRGWRTGGVAPTVKHFPGLGGATVNTDDGTVRIARSAAQLRRHDLLPFRSAIAAVVPLVMVGHATYPAFDPRHIASQSKAVIDGLLRGELGFRGVVMTDSIEAAAVLAVARPAEAAVRNVRAGADIVPTTGRGSYSPVYRALLGERAATRLSARGYGSPPRVCWRSSANSRAWAKSL